MTVLSSPVAGQGLPAAEEQAADGKLGVRVRYQVFFDEVLGGCDSPGGTQHRAILFRAWVRTCVRGSRPGEGQGGAMSTCLVAVRLPRAVPR
jgi:hypothetical protein